ncbi:hypothetical protein JOQ06_023594, partial [Pogonophryne albipinna]
MSRHDISVDISVALCLLPGHSIVVGDNMSMFELSHDNLIKGPPRVSERVAHRQSVRLGRTMKLPCPVEGDPPPLIMWTKDGRNIHSGWTRFRVLQHGLRIKEVEPEDAGTYICKATNGFGSVNINYTLIVIGLPSNFSNHYRSVIQSCIGIDLNFKGELAYRGQRGGGAAAAAEGWGLSLALQAPLSAPSELLGLPAVTTPPLNRPEEMRADEGQDR